MARTTRGAGAGFYSAHFQWKGTQGEGLEIVEHNVRLTPNLHDIDTAKPVERQHEGTSRLSIWMSSLPAACLGRS